ncbi:MAG: hypothetical protein HY892_12920 [Deltaproteobacteria bacterium]|nr:hypothetical protein [Deltaproteobacteria bacterium]
MLTRWFCLLILIGLATTTVDGSHPAWAQNREIKEFRVSSLGYLRLAVPDGWKAEFQRPITEEAPTIIFLPPKGDAFKLLLTVQWDGKVDPDFNSSSRIKALLEKEWQEMAPSIKETRLEAKAIQGTFAKGFYFLATDKEPQPGDYEYLLRAGAGFGKLLLSATLVFQEKNSPVVLDTVHLLGSASLVAN